MSTCGKCDRKVEEGQKFCEEHRLEAMSKFLNMGLMQSKPNVAGSGIMGHAAGHTISRSSERANLDRGDFSLPPEGERR